MSESVEALISETSSAAIAIASSWRTRRLRLMDGPDVEADGRELVNPPCGRC